MNENYEFRGFRNPIIMVLACDRTVTADRSGTEHPAIYLERVLEKRT